MPFVADSFTDVDGTLLADHVGEVGATWTVWGSDAGTQPQLSDDQLTRIGGGSACSLYASGVPAGADYDVSMDMTATGALGDGYAFGLLARLDTATHNGYLLQYESWSGGRLTLYSAVPGDWTLLERAASGLGLVTLRVQGDQIIALVNGVEVFRSTNSDHAAAGSVGVRVDAPGDGYRGDDFLAADAGEIDPPGIAPTVTVGTPEIIRDGVIVPSGVPSSLAVGTPRINAIQHVTLTDGIASTAAVGPLTRVRAIGRLLQPTGIAPTAAVGAPTLLSAAPQSVRPTAVRSTAACGVPSLSLEAAAPIQAVGIDPAARVGTPVIILSLVPSGGGGGGGGRIRLPTPRNYLIDPVTHQVYPWPINHSTEDAVKTLGRRLQRSGVTQDGRLIMQPTHPGSAHLVLHGSMLDRDPPTQYQTFVQFFHDNADREFVYIDAARDAYRIIIVNFDAQRKHSLAHDDGSYFNYSLEVEVKEAITGSLKGYV